jgi:hypothetical protein
VPKALTNGVSCGATMTRLKGYVVALKVEIPYMEAIKKIAGEKPLQQIQH